jgi:hypothetical protein
MFEVLDNSYVKVLCLLFFLYYTYSYYISKEYWTSFWYGLVCIHVSLVISDMMKIISYKQYEDPVVLCGCICWGLYLTYSSYIEKSYFFSSAFFLTTIVTTTPFVMPYLGIL